MDHHSQTHAATSQARSETSDTDDPHVPSSVPAAFAQSSGFAAVARTASDPQGDDTQH